jgi:hypothetical protein
MLCCLNIHAPGNHSTPASSVSAFSTNCCCQLLLLLLLILLLLLAIVLL